MVFGAIAGAVAASVASKVLSPDSKATNYASGSPGNVMDNIYTRYNKIISASKETKEHAPTSGFAPPGKTQIPGMRTALSMFSNGDPVYGAKLALAAAQAEANKARRMSSTSPQAWKRFSGTTTTV